MNLDWATLTTRVQMVTMVSRRWLSAVLLTGIAACAPVALAASFDCAKANTPIEKAICGDPGLSQLDSDYGAVFTRAVARNPQVRQQVIDWLRNVRNKCDTYECLTAAYKSEIQILSSEAASSSPNPNGATLPAVVVAQLQLTCPVDWDIAINTVRGANLNQVAFGIPASEWTKEHVDQMLAKSEQCIRDDRTGTDGFKQSMLNFVRNTSYPEALNALSLRDQHLQEAAAQAKQVEEERQRKVEMERQQQIQQQQRDAEVQRIEVQRKADEQKSNNLWIVLGALVVFVGGWVWNRFVRNRCPNCKSSSFDRVNETEMDRWQGTKQITEKHSRGTNTRHIRTTYVRKLFEYRCKSCRHEWTKERQEELGSENALSRYFLGY